MDIVGFLKIGAILGILLLLIFIARFLYSKGKEKGQIEGANHESQDIINAEAELAKKSYSDDPNDGFIVHNPGAWGKDSSPQT